jgi:UDP-glucose 4-epimerase
MPGDIHAEKLSAFPQVQIVEGDLCDQQSVDRACQDATHIVHLAAQMVRGDTPVDRFYDVNTFSTLRLLEGALNSRARLERFVLASTDSTYRPGAPPAQPLTEDVKQEPADYYGTSKLLGEIILRNRAAQFDIPFSIVRFGTVLSPEEADSLFRLRFLRGWLRTQQGQGRRATMWPLFEGRPNLTEILDAAVGSAADDTAIGFVGPDREPWRLSMVDVRDAAQGVCCALTEPGAVGRAFNIAAAEPTTYEAAASAIAEIFGVPKLIVQMPMCWQLNLSIEAARRHIGYRPQYDYWGTLQAARAGSLAAADVFIPAAEGNSGVFAQLSGGQAQGASARKGASAGPVHR